MTTRHVSAQSAYPFILDPERVYSANIEQIKKGILDTYFVIQGTPDISTEESGSSSSGGAECTTERTVRLISVVDQGTTSLFIFYATEGGDIWQVWFEVPNTEGFIGSVQNIYDNDVQATLLYNSADIFVGDVSVDIQVEPSRAQFHTERVLSLSFNNIARCNGLEDPSTLLPVLVLSEGSSSEEGPSLSLIDGYNTELEFDVVTEEIVFSAQQGIGKGAAPDLGNDLTCTDPVTNPLDDLITTVNGIAPVNGDIPIDVTRSLGTQRNTGKIEIIPRF